jgi:hypothetical protein
VGGDMRVTKAIEVLTEELNDIDYRRSWIANIAMRFKDNVDYYRYKNKNKRSKYLNRTDIHIIANKAAQEFIDFLFPTKKMKIKQEKLKKLNIKTVIKTK